MNFIDKNLQGMLTKKGWSRQRLTQKDITDRIEFNLKNRHRICKIMRVKKPHSIVYKNKLKRCTKCDVYYSIPELNCPCCNTRLRLHIRNKTGTVKNHPDNDTRLRI